MVSALSDVAASRLFSPHQIFFQSLLRHRFGIKRITQAIAEARETVQTALNERGEHDVQLITFARHARVVPLAREATELPEALPRHGDETHTDAGAGSNMAAALQLGAVAAQLGTAFIGCPESSADAAYRSALAGEAAHHTRLTTLVSGRPARALSNRFTALEDAARGLAVPDYPRAYDAGKQLHAVAKAAGEHGFGAQWAGQGAPLARALPVAELVARLAEELRESVTGSR